jgi:hypothetical protein
MAERVSGHGFRRPSRTRYPWDEWLDGSTWRLVPGEDFATSPESFRRSAYGAAYARNGKVRTDIENGSFFLQFVKNGGES